MNLEKIFADDTVRWYTEIVRNNMEFMVNREIVCKNFVIYCSQGFHQLLGDTSYSNNVRVINENIVSQNVKFNNGYVCLRVD